MDKRSVVAGLLGCDAAALLGFSLVEGGGASVVEPGGRKLYFSEEELIAAYAQSVSKQEMREYSPAVPKSHDNTPVVAVVPPRPGRRQTSARQTKVKR